MMNIRLLALFTVAIAAPIFVPASHAADVDVLVDWIKYVQNFETTEGPLEFCRVSSLAATHEKFHSSK
jgi:hypothetical protein